MTEPTMVYTNTSALIAAEEPGFPGFLFSERSCTGRSRCSGRVLTGC